MLAITEYARRAGFTEMLAWATENGVATILVESASRFARDLIVQETGHALLAKLGFTLIAADDPDAFTADTPTARMVRQILGAVAEFEKTNLVVKLKGARERKRAAQGRCEGRRGLKDTAPEQKQLRAAKRLAHKSPKTGHRRSLRQIAAALAQLGHVNGWGRVYSPTQIARMLAV
jgi:DNA invertase Pin-like site-specific DNA recombinase